MFMYVRTCCGQLDTVWLQIFVVQYFFFREFRDRSHDPENFIHEIFAYTYTRIPVARNHEIYFHENLLLSRFREIHENFEPRKFGAIRY